MSFTLLFDVKSFKSEVWSCVSAMHGEGGRGYVPKNIQHVSTLPLEMCSFKGQKFYSDFPVMGRIRIQLLEGRAAGLFLAA